MPITGLSHMTFVVKDIDAMARFLCEERLARYAAINPPRQDAAR